MQTPQNRTVFTVCPVIGGWAVQHDGVVTDRSPDKSIAQAAASRLARAAMSDGRTVQVRVDGEMGYF